LAKTGDPPFPLDAETRLVIKLLRDAAAKCRRAILNPPGGTDSGRAFASSRAAQQLQGINRELDALNARLARVGATKVAQAYQNGLREGEQLAKDVGVAPADSAFRGSFSVVDKRRAAVLAVQVVGDLTKAVKSIKDTTGKIVRQSQAMGLDNAKINTILAGGTIEGTPRQTLQALKKEVRKAAIDGKIVTVNGTTGVTMRFDPGYYAEMVFQTKLAETTNIATVQRLRARKINHIKVIGSNSRNFCTAFVGRVFYIGDGTDALAFPHLRELPRGGAPFHPRCTKRYTAFVAGLQTPEAIEAGRLKPHERELLGPESAKAQRLYQPPAKPPATVKPLRQPLVTPQPASETRDDDPVLVGRSDDSGALAVRIDVNDKAVAESASRAWDRCKKAGFNVPKVIKDRPDLSIFQPGVGDNSFAAYHALTDEIYVNSNSPNWANIKDLLRAGRLANKASTDDPDHVIIHEIGHYAHRNAVGLDRYLEIRKMRFSPEEVELVTKHVSSYAATQPVEMIAEVFAAKIAGRVMPKAVLDLYRRYGGA
jgi:hypothetical protein